MAGDNLPNSRDIKAANRFIPEALAEIGGPGAVFYTKTGDAVNVLPLGENGQVLGVEDGALAYIDGGSGGGGVMRVQPAFTSDAWRGTLQTGSDAGETVIVEDEPQPNIEIATLGGDEFVRVTAAGRYHVRVAARSSESTSWLMQRYGEALFPVDQTNFFEPRPGQGPTSYLVDYEVTVGDEGADLRIVFDNSSATVSEGSVIIEEVTGPPIAQFGPTELPPVAEAGGGTGGGIKAFNRLVITDASSQGYTIDNFYGWSGRIQTNQEPQLAAAPGDIIQVELSFHTGVDGDAQGVYTDIHTIVSGSPVRSFSGGGTSSNGHKGLSGMIAPAGSHYRTGTFFLQLTEDDVFNDGDGPRVRLRPGWRLADDTGNPAKKVFAWSQEPFMMTAINLGPSAS